MLAWRRSELSWKARFADDCALPPATLCPGSPAVVVSQAPVASAASGRKSGDGLFDPAATGSTVWDGALLLAAHLSQTRTLAALEKAAGRPLLNWLELGAGTGLCGLALAASGTLPPVSGRRRRLVLTDLHAVTPFLAANVARNAGALALPTSAAVSVAPLRWGDAKQAAALAPRGCGAACWDVVVGADLVYRTENVELLLAALQQLVAPGGVAVLASDLAHSPLSVDLLCASAAAAGFRLRLAAAAELHPGFVCEDGEPIRVMELWRL